MGPISPLRKHHVDRGAAFARFPPEDSVYAAGADRAEVVADFGDVESEHAAMRNGAAVFDATHQRVLVATGPDRLDFLNRMLTQDLKKTEVGACANAFWLNRKGRIEADVRVLNPDEEAWLIVDGAVAARTVESLSSYLVMEDVELRDGGTDWVTLAVIGPQAERMVRSIVDDPAVPPWAPNTAIRTTIDGAPVVMDVAFVCEYTGASIHVSQSDAIRVYERLIDAGAVPAGHSALERARVHAAEPRFLIDFGAESLPHETGLLQSRVSFTKGCYLGQEVVARMQSLGQPKQKMTVLHFDATRSPSRGVRLLSTESPSGDAVGVVTSAQSGPEHGTAMGLGQVRTKWAHQGAALQTENGLRCVVDRVLDEIKIQRR